MGAAFRRQGNGMRVRIVKGALTPPVVDGVAYDRGDGLANGIPEVLGATFALEAEERLSGCPRVTWQQSSSWRGAVSVSTN